MSEYTDPRSFTEPQLKRMSYEQNGLYTFFNPVMRTRHGFNAGCGTRVILPSPNIPGTARHIDLLFGQKGALPGAGGYIIVENNPKARESFLTDEKIRAGLRDYYGVPVPFRVHEGELIDFLDALPASEKVSMFLLDTCSALSDELAKSLVACLRRSATRAFFCDLVVSWRFDGGMAAVAAAANDIMDAVQATHNIAAIFFPYYTTPRRTPEEGGFDKGMIYFGFFAFPKTGSQKRGERLMPDEQNADPFAAVRGTCQLGFQQNPEIFFATRGDHRSYLAAYLAQ